MKQEYIVKIEFLFRFLSNFSYVFLCVKYMGDSTMAHKLSINAKVLSVCRLKIKKN